LAVTLDRLQAVVMLRELVANDLVDPSYFSMVEAKPNHFQIQIKCDYNRLKIEEYAKKYALTITEDKDRKYLLIFKK
jgi:hypothetical protein